MTGFLSRVMSSPAIAASAGAAANSGDPSGGGGGQIDFIGHVANSDPLIHLGPFFGIDFSITKHVLMLWLVALLLFVFVTAIVRGYLRRGAMVPTGAANALETVVEFVRDSMVRPNVGDKWVATWTPLLLTFFLFILTANAIGLVPIFEVIALVDHWFLHSPEDSFVKHLLHGGATATGNFNVTAGLATVTFFSIIVAGTLAHGFVKHFKNLVPHGLPAPIYLLLVPMEIVGMFVRPFALTMRLAANMTGGHIAILAILSFVFIFAEMLGPIGGIGIGLGFSVPVAGAMLGLEIIVVLVQAYVFTLLSAVFIGMAIHAHH
jgi:F-type H+-transporting ATPase subunit a